MTLRFLSLCLALMFLLVAPGWGQSGNEPAKEAVPAGPTVIRVPLPIDQRVREQVVRSAEGVLDRYPATARAQERPVLILEFETDRGRTGSGSKLADCLEIASILTSERFAGVRTVAYVPGLRTNRVALDPASRKGVVLEGHALLVALAAEQIVLDPSATIGSAISREERFDGLTVDVYRNIASRRLTLPTSVALALIDPAVSLQWITTAAGEELADRERQQQLEATGQVIQAETLKRSGELASFSASQLERLSPNCLIAADRNELAAKLRIAAPIVEVEGRSQRQWKAVRFQLPGNLDQRGVDWGIRAIDQQIRARGANLVIVGIDGGGADYKAALRLARYLAELDPEEILTVAYVEKEGAAGPLALVALACHHLLLQTEAKLGGEYEPPLYADEVKTILSDLPFLAEARQRHLGLLRGMVDLDWSPIRMQNIVSGEERWVDAAETGQLELAGQWVNRGPQDLTRPLTANECESLNIARLVVANDSELAAYYQLGEEPKLLKPTDLDRMLARFAAFLASPLVSFWLVMFAIMLLSTESSSPGLGVPGFLGIVFLVLFFWSQYFDGNATWFEILLFVTGAVFLLIELFVLPGFGVFGIGGILMMITAVVLATQTFVIPRTQREFEQLPYTLGMALALAGGGLVALMIFRRYARQMPMVREMMLEPPKAEEDYERELARSGLVVEVGQRGVTVTRLLPSGKARIGNRLVDVISDGTVIEAGAAVEVVEAVANRIVVRSVADRV